MVVVWAVSGWMYALITNEPLGMTLANERLAPTPIRALRLPSNPQWTTTSVYTLSPRRGHLWTLQDALYPQLRIVD